MIVHTGRSNVGLEKACTCREACSRNRTGSGGIRLPSGHRYLESREDPGRITLQYPPHVQQRGVGVRLEPRYRLVSARLPFLSSPERWLFLDLGSRKTDERRKQRTTCR